MNDKFPLLSIISGLLRVFGFLLLLVSLYYSIWEGFVEPNLPGHNFTQIDLIQLLGGLFGSLFGLVAIASGEVIAVLFAIEKNTRQPS
ncbi:MAG: hypothetical protein KDN04_20205 [Verrucomicrobiae bacterium]|nr:hypothetical protein [Verrucomicrobiae bacterium]